MNTLKSNLTIIAGLVLLLAVLGSVVALALHGDVPGSEAMAVIGTLITLGGGMLGATLGFGAATAHTTALLRLSAIPSPEGTRAPIGPQTASYALLGALPLPNDTWPPPDADPGPDNRESKTVVPTP